MSEEKQARMNELFESLTKKLRNPKAFSIAGVLDNNICRINLVKCVRKMLQRKLKITSSNCLGSLAKRN